MSELDKELEACLLSNEELEHAETVAFLQWQKTSEYNTAMNSEFAYQIARDRIFRIAHARAQVASPKLAALLEAKVAEGRKAERAVFLALGYVKLAADQSVPECPRFEYHDVDACETKCDFELMKRNCPMADRVKVEPKVVPE